MLTDREMLPRTSSVSPCKPFRTSSGLRKVRVWAEEKTSRGLHKPSAVTSRPAARQTTNSPTQGPRSAPSDTSAVPEVPVPTGPRLPGCSQEAGLPPCLAPQPPDTAAAETGSGPR